MPAVQTTSPQRLPFGRQDGARPAFLSPSPWGVGHEARNVRPTSQFLDERLVHKRSFKKGTGRMDEASPMLC